MSELKVLVEQGWEALNKSVDSMCLDAVPPELVSLTIQDRIMQSGMLSRAVEKPEELQKLANAFFGNFPFSKSRKTRPWGIPTDITRYISSIERDGHYLLLAYGVQAHNESLQANEFADTVYQGAVESNNLMVLPEHPRAKEVITMLIQVDHKRRQIAEKNGGNYVTLSPWIASGLNDWKAALVLAGYSHVWWRLIDENLRLSTNMYHNLRKNVERYKRFGLTSFDKVKQVTPGALFQVENVFGDFAAQYVAGDLGRFKKLSRYAQMKDAKKIF